MAHQLQPVPIPNSFSYQTLTGAKHTPPTLNPNLMDPYNVNQNIEYTTYTDNVWQSIVAKISPLFNGEGIKGSIEDINDLVRQWVRETPTSHILQEISDLLNSGMKTTTAKLHQVPDELFTTRMVESWSFFFITILPYIQGVFLPVRLVRSGVGPGITTMGRGVNGSFSEKRIDIRSLAILAFRDNAVFPLYNRIEDIIPRIFQEGESGRRVADIAARFTQMLAVIYQESNGDERLKILDLLKILKQSRPKEQK